MAENEIRKTKKKRKQMKILTKRKKLQLWDYQYGG